MCNFSRAFQEKKFISIGVPSEKLYPFKGGLSELGFVAVETELDANRWIGGGWKIVCRLIFSFFL
jgi:hypothetical protein